MSHLEQWVPRRSMISSKSNMGRPFASAGQELVPRAGRSCLSRRGGFAYLAAMAIRPILIHPDPRLRKAAARVEAVDDEHARAGGGHAGDDVRGAGDRAGGDAARGDEAGLRHGLRRQGRAAAADGAGQPGDPLALGGDWQTSEEGCLSIPEVYEDVTRPERVRLRWMGLDGAMHEAEFGERWAVCAQHEMDHLNGRLFIDYLLAVKRTMITARMRKLKREKARA